MKKKNSEKPKTIKSVLLLLLVMVMVVASFNVPALNVQAHNSSCLNGKSKDLLIKTGKITITEYESAELGVKEYYVEDKDKNIVSVTNIPIKSGKKTLYSAEVKGKSLGKTYVYGKNSSNKIVFKMSVTVYKVSTKTLTHESETVDGYSVKQTAKVKMKVYKDFQKKYHAECLDSSTYSASQKFGHKYSRKILKKASELGYDVYWVLQIPGSVANWSGGNYKVRGSKSSIMLDSSGNIKKCTLVIDYSENPGDSDDRKSKYSDHPDVNATYLELLLRVRPQSNKIVTLTYPAIMK